MGRAERAAPRLEANRPSISRLALGCRFGGLGKSQPVGAGRVVNGSEEAALHVLDQLAHQGDSAEDQDNERKKH